MCLDCWQRYGCPKEVNPNILKAAELISAIYKFSTIGGNLHIQLDDWNIDNEYWERFKPFREDTTEEELKIEHQCFEIMKILSIKERASALALHDGYWFYNKQIKAPS